MIADLSAPVVLDGRDDRELMKQIESGSTVAFEELYDRYSTRAYRVAGSVCHDSANAEDAVQEAFLSVWKNRSAYHPDRGTVAAWLLTSVRYRAMDVARRDQTRNKRHATGDLLQGRPAAGNVPEQAVARDEAARLRVLLKRIPDSQREVITLAFYGQLTHLEIATHLQLPAGTIKGRMRLGLKKLRSRLEQDGA